jgi:CBS domain containing-hemolysin-like protein
MSPRTEIVAIDLFDTIAELKELFIETVTKLWSMRIHLMRL